MHAWHRRGERAGRRAKDAVSSGPAPRLRSGLAPAVFLDRDGTLIEDVGYLDRLDKIAWYPWTIDAVRALNRAGLPVVVVTNQAGVARGFFDETFVDETHRHLSAALAAGGARIDAYYYCPHHPDGKVEAYARRCDCRKPATGLVYRAARDLGLDPARSFVVGDTWLDVGLGRAVGARSILVRTGGGARWEARPQPTLTADAIVDNLAAAASWILTNLPSI
ncbi:MAG: HAD family hydrolase [Acidobacteria bacterium]|nr:HAD family hydrolase [Acidobacteriota bacterium]